MQNGDLPEVLMDKQLGDEEKLQDVQPNSSQMFQLSAVGGNSSSTSEGPDLAVVAANQYLTLNLAKHIAETDAQRMRRIQMLRRTGDPSALSSMNNVSHEEEGDAIECCWFRCPLS